MRLTRILSACAILFAAAPVLRAEYVNLRSGQRLHVTGYQLLGESYRLQVAGGVVEVPATDVVSIDPEDDFAPLPPPVVAAAPFHEIVKAAAARYNVDADLITSVIAAESNFNPKAVSRRNARGLMQLLPETAAHFGARNIFDPRENIDAGTHYLRDLLQRYNNDLALALAAYNAGPQRVEQFGNVPPYPETVSYIRRVRRAYAKSKSRKSANAAPNSATHPTLAAQLAGILEK
ncbi:MAG: lytic transglycosylase domain-containing protein [Candidatus Acidiferrum sp.]